MFDSDKQYSEGISIITTYYNNGNYFNEFIQSYNNLNMRTNKELIIVDNGSDSTDYLNTVLQQASDSISVIKQYSNTGVQDARNKGLEKAKYSYTIMIDGDDIFTTESACFIEEAISILKEHQEVAFVHGLTYMFGDFSGYTISSYPLTLKQAAEMHHIPTSIIYRTKEATCVGGYNETIKKWQDWAFGIALLNCKLKETHLCRIAFIPKKVICYRTRDSKNRLSQKEYKIIDEIRKTVTLYKDFFCAFYDIDICDIPAVIMDNKPSRLVELLNVAMFDYDLAIEIINERGYDVNHDPSKEWIP